MVLSALSTEERRKKNVPSDVVFRFRGEKVIRRLQQRELKFNIMQPIRKMDFSLAAPVYSWANGCSLAELESFGIPEGDLVRVLRMSIQLMRTLRAKLDDPVVADRMHEALLLVNRGIVDAQAELEVE